MFEKLDKTDFKVLNFIADRPYSKLYLREISKNLKISPSSVKKALDVLEKNNLVKRRPEIVKRLQKTYADWKNQMAPQLGKAKRKR